MMDINRLRGYPSGHSKNQGFPNWVPPKCMVYTRKSENQIDDLGGPYFRKPPFVNLMGFHGG